MRVSTYLISSTLGLVFPKYRTLGKWVETYSKIIEGKPVQESTKCNRICLVKHILKYLGKDTIISNIKPHDISNMVMFVHKEHPQLGKRILIESKDLFNEAVNYMWLIRSPAASIKYPQVKVLRDRLTLDQWKKIYKWSCENQPPWVSRLLVLALVTAQRRSDLEKLKFSDVWDNHLHIIQEKTNSKLALPLNLKLEAINVTLEQAIEDCKGYYAGEEYMIRKHNGHPLVEASLSQRFEEAREGALPELKSKNPPSLHECRSLSERLYRKQGINTMILLGHKHQSMTDLYNNERNLSRDSWKILTT